MKKNNTLIWLFSYAMLNILIETLQRSSIADAISYFSANPHIFLYNMLLLIFLSFFIFFFRRRRLLFVIYSFLWIALALTSGIKSSFRGDPLMIQDFFLIKEAAGISGDYLNLKNILLISVLMILFVFSAIILWKRKSEKINRKFIIAIASYAFIFPIYAKIFLSSCSISPILWDMHQSYLNYGFPYSFTETVLSLHSRKPEGYSKENINKIKSSIDDESNSVNNDFPRNDPNIIVIQLESFFDPFILNNVTYSRDPIDYFHSLTKDFSSGNISVSSIGGGTCNTEFEVLTGLNMDFLSPGSTPYVQTLNVTPVESMAYVLHNMGYDTSALHSYWGSFYSRIDVFKNLGFQRFISGEFIPNKTKSGGWCEDKILISEIDKLLNTSDNRDFIFTVALQTHGPYSSDELISEEGPKVYGPFSESETINFENYLYQLEQCDEFIEGLINNISLRREPTVVVFYGDHLPSLGENYSTLNAVNLNDEDRYITPYVIWDNIGLASSNEDIEAYMMSSKIFSLLGMDGGVLNKFHKLFSHSSEYMEIYNILQYDLLFGKNYYYNGYFPYNIPDMALGTEDLLITDVFLDDESLIIKGSGFTENTKLHYNKSLLNCEFIDSETLCLASSFLKKDDVITAVMTGSKDNIIKTSPLYIIN